MMGLKFMDDVPFHEVYVHGLVRDSQGQKMSKSKGNVLDPIDLIDGIDLEDLVTKRTSGMMQPQLAKKIEQQTRKEFPDGIAGFGTDAVRFTFAALASTGRDIKFDMGRIEGYRNFCNKLWNAARYVLMNTEGQDCGAGAADIELSAADRWILSKLQSTIETTTKALEDYRFDHAATAIYEFTWNNFCDWYLELSKPILNDDQATDAAKRGTRQTLIRTLEALLRLTHPIMPYITEEIWQRIAPLSGITGVSETSIMRQPYPVTDHSQIDKDAVTEMEWVMQFILGIRRIKGEMDIKPSKKVPVLLADTSKTDQLLAERHRGYLDFLARVESIRILPEGDSGPESAIALVGDMKILIPLSGLIDKDAELTRLDKEISKLSQDVERIEKKLSNPHFVDRAPEAVVQKERDKLSSAQAAIDNLAAQADKIRQL